VSVKRFALPHKRRVVIRRLRNRTTEKEPKLIANQFLLLDGKHMYRRRTRVRLLHKGTVAHETAVGRNPPINKFIENTEIIDAYLMDQHLRVLYFYGNIRRRNFLWIQDF
jgi:hypothetical protein